MGASNTSVCDSPHGGLHGEMQSDVRHQPMLFRRKSEHVGDAVRHIADMSEVDQDDAYSYGAVQPTSC